MICSIDFIYSVAHKTTDCVLVTDYVVYKRSACKPITGLHSNALTTDLSSLRAFKRCNDFFRCYVLISFYYVVFLSSVILLLLRFLGQLLVQCNYCLVVLPPLSLVVYYSCLTLVT